MYTLCLFVCICAGRQAGLLLRTPQGTAAQGQPYCDVACSAHLSTQAILLLVWYGRSFGVLANMICAQIIVPKIRTDSA